MSFSASLIYSIAWFVVSGLGLVSIFLPFITLAHADAAGAAYAEIPFPLLTRVMMSLAAEAVLVVASVVGILLSLRGRKHDPERSSLLWAIPIGVNTMTLGHAAILTLAWMKMAPMFQQLGFN